MSDYNPTTYLVRVLSSGDNGTSITLDTNGDDVLQQTTTSMVKALGNVFLKIYEIKLAAGDAAYFEVLLGATANQLSRREDLLNDARNMLIDVESSCEIDVAERVANLIGDIGKEIGVPS